MGIFKQKINNKPSRSGSPAERKDIMKKEQKDNLFALLFFIGFAVSFVFNHVNELLWWFGVVAMTIGIFGILKKASDVENE